MKKEYIYPTITSMLLSVGLIVYLYSHAWIGSFMNGFILVVGIGLVIIGSAMVGIGFGKLAHYWANMEETEANE